MTQDSPLPHLVAALGQASLRHPTERKLVVAPSFGAGRELLRRLSLAGDGWIGFEVTTPRRLAARLGRPEIERAAARTMDSFEQQALLDEAMDGALLAEGKGLGELGEGVGFRERVHGAITAMRLSGIGPEELDRARLADWSKRLFLLRVLRRYEHLLSDRRLADPATVLRLALAALEAEGNRMPASLGAAHVLLVPGLSTRGLAGRFLAELQSRGAKVLETDPGVGLQVPDSVLWAPATNVARFSTLYAPDVTTDASEGAKISLFRAASITDELREVLRRVAENGLGWDEVEIVAADPVGYGSALHALSSQLGVPVTYAVGLPVERTRPGRVARAYLDWIEEGFQADPIRRLLEAGDLRPSRSKGRHAPAALARRFRALRVGWGRKRYRTQIRTALSALEDLEPQTWQSTEAFERHKQRARSELIALRSVLFPALQATPAVPDRVGEGDGTVSPSELARGLRAFLRRTPRGRGADRGAREQIGVVLERVEATLRRRTDFRAAVTILRRHLDIRVRAPEPAGALHESGAPWSSEGGHLHLSDIAHGGYSGRRAVFIVGADAERLPGPGSQDPVLLDSDRRVLGAGLPTSSELLRERVFGFAALMARIRGPVCLSHSAWDATVARVVGPSPILLQALRLRSRDSAPTFKDLDVALGRVICRVPAPGRAPLDSDDVWMSELGAGAVLREGVELVRGAFRPLDAGLTGEEARRGVPGAIHGLVAARPQDFDPRINPSLVVSASRLEDLGACPLRYLQKSILRMRPPDDPEMDPDRWLDPRQRGGVLHEVFERTLRAATEEAIRLEDPGFEALAVRTLEVVVQRVRNEVPVPGEGALRREQSALVEDVRSFVRMVREAGAPWVELELKFGLGDDEPVLFELGGGPLRLRGAIDRVDRDLRGLHVIDYKTGGAWNFQAETGAFHGGRRLQHALYAHAAEQRLGGDVATGSYHYPTRKGQNQAFVFERARLDPIHSLLDHMLDSVAAGSFVPTEQAGDCKFCDYAPVCRVQDSGFGDPHSPMAEWSLEQLNLGLAPAFAQMRKVREFEK